MKQDRQMKLLVEDTRKRAPVPPPGDAAEIVRCMADLLLQIATRDQGKAASEEDTDEGHA